MEPLLQPLFLIVAVLTTACKRLYAHRWLELGALLALVIVVALTVSMPLYAEGAYVRLLQKEMARQEQQAGRSPFALLFRYVGAWNEPLAWERIKAADTFLSEEAVEHLALPLEGVARHARTGHLQLFMPPAAGTGNQLLTDVTVGFVTGLDAQIHIIAGTMPRAATDRTQPVEVMIMRSLADSMGINVGEPYQLVTKVRGNVVTIPIVITALWEPVNPRDPAWFFQPAAFHDVLLVPEMTFTGPIAASLQHDVDQALWFIRLNDDAFTAPAALPLLERIEQVQAHAAGLVPGLQLEQSPGPALHQYREQVATLTWHLFLFSAPVFGLVLFFASLIATLLVQRQRSAIALLKTRGVRDLQIIGMYLVEWLMLSTVALAIGPFLGLVFATGMSHTSSFLTFSADLPALALVLTWGHVRFGALALLMALVCALPPIIVATRHTLVNEQQHLARTLHPPFWQRFYLDVLVVAPPAYGIYQLQRSGGIAGSSMNGSDPLTNPLLLIIPVLLCFGLSLLSLRLFPIIFDLCVSLARGPAWTAPLVAMWTVARQPGMYRGALLLLVLTLSLATFSASMARTLDGSLHQAIHYQVGAATRLIETGQSTEQAQPARTLGSDVQQPARRTIEEAARFLFAPVDDHLAVPGIVAATRVGSYEASLQPAGLHASAQLVGVDRLTLGKVLTHFDPAWSAGASLGALMNRLAHTPEGVIVSRDIVNAGLTVGDMLPTRLTLFGDQREVQFVIVAVVDLWPGYYPQDGPILVANLDYLFDQMGGRYPYDVWIERDPAALVPEIVADVRKTGITVVDVHDAATMIREEQMRPQRQGLFGVLSVGFITAGLLTLLGFLLSALITARRRIIELGLLRAIGMSRRSVVLVFLTEQLALVLAGTAAGTGAGLLVANLVVPVMQVSIGPQPGIPPYPPQMAWNQVALIYAIAAVTLLITIGTLTWILGRMRLFQAVKLGDVN
jgi:putative ABC transport system permease protein